MGFIWGIVSMFKPSPGRIIYLAKLRISSRAGGCGPQEVLTEEVALVGAR